MVGIIDYMTCGVCKSPGSLYYEFQTRTGEEHGYCSKCGYSFHSTLFIDRKKTSVMNDGKTYILFKKDGTPRLRFYERKAFGSFSYKHNGYIYTKSIYKENDIPKIIKKLTKMKTEGYEVSMTIFVNKKLEMINF